MHEEQSLNQVQKEWHGTLKAYIIGFALSVLLTAASFYIVATGQPYALAIVIALALGQATCQLLFFLHLGQEPKPRWESLIFYFMILVLVIIVVGTLWVMHDLNSRVMVEMLHD